jgi:hypothetical protein
MGEGEPLGTTFRPTRQFDAKRQSGRPGKFKQPFLTNTKRESSAYYASARLWDDPFIERHMVLKLSLDAALSQSSQEKLAYGIFRM